jgi:hypothetical protein
MSYSEYTKVGSIKYIKVTGHIPVVSYHVAGVRAPAEEWPASFELYSEYTKEGSRVVYKAG